MQASPGELPYIRQMSFFCVNSISLDLTIAKGRLPKYGWGFPSNDPERQRFWLFKRLQMEHVLVAEGGIEPPTYGL